MNRIGNMRESTERIVPVGFTKDPKLIFDEVEKISAEMIRLGWGLYDSRIEEDLGNIHLFFERKITIE